MLSIFVVDKIPDGFRALGSGGADDFLKVWPRDVRSVFGRFRTYALDKEDDCKRARHKRQYQVSKTPACACRRFQLIAEARGDAPNKRKSEGPGAQGT